MKILLAGGGTGGHFYPLIAVAEEINRQAKEMKLLDAKMYYMGPSPYNERALFENNITFKKMSAGKARRYFSLMNFFDIFKTAWGLFTSLLQIYSIYPDVVFAKGGYASFPALFSAKILGIPVIIHESDSVPGRLNIWAGKFAQKIAVSYPEAAKYFPEGKVAWTGNPIRKELFHPITDGAKDFLKLEEKVPVIFIIGGSLGSQIINETILDALPRLVQNYQIIHQTGKANFKSVKTTADVALFQSDFKYRYKPFDYLDELSLRMSAGAADIIVSRAGSAIFEIAAWGVPSIIIPIADSQGDHQRQNAFAYERSGAAVVIEENNLSANILISEINRLILHPEEREKMKEAAKQFVKPDAAGKIAKEIILMALAHEK